PWRDAVPYAELIKHVRIEQRDVGHDDVGRDQLVKHVGSDISGAGFFVGSERHAAGLLKRRLDQVFIYLIEVHVDRWYRRQRVGGWRRPSSLLHAEGHHDED